MKILNLDEMAPTTEVELVWRNKTHKMKILLVKEMLEQMRVAEAKIKAAKEDDSEGSMLGMVEEMVSSIRDAFPTLTDEDVDIMEAGHVGAIFDLINKAATNENEEKAKEVKKPTRTKKKSKR